MKNKICDICEGEWEETFFCKKCSNKVETIEALVPILDWDGIGDDYEVGEEDILMGDVCLNCCDCHLR